MSNARSLSSDTSQPILSDFLQKIFLENCGRVARNLHGRLECCGTKPREELAMAFVVRVCLIAAALLASHNLFAADGTSVHRTEDVIYGRKFGMALTLDVFQPAPPIAAGWFLVNGGWRRARRRR